MKGKKIIIFLFITFFISVSIFPNELRKFESTLIDLIKNKKEKQVISTIIAYKMRPESPILITDLVLDSILEECGKNNCLSVIKYIKETTKRSDKLKYYKCLYGALESKEEYLEMIKYLVDNGLVGVNNETVTGIDKKVMLAVGITPLNKAAANKHFEIIKYLLKKGAKIDHLTLCKAIGFDRSSYSKEERSKLIEKIYNIVNILVEYGADINIGYFVSTSKTSSAFHETYIPLYLAVVTYNLPVVQYLLKNEADPNVPYLVNHNFINISLTGKPGFDYYIPQEQLNKKEGHKKYLIDTSITYYIIINTDEEESNIQWQIINSLIKNGADLNLLDNNNETILHKSLTGDFPKKEEKVINVYKLLFENNIKPDIQNKKGQTVLHQAILRYDEIEEESGLLKLCKLLVDNNVDPKVKDKNGETAFDYAKKKKFKSIKKFLKSIK